MPAGSERAGAATVLLAALLWGAPAAAQVGGDPASRARALLREEAEVLDGLDALDRRITGLSIEQTAMRERIESRERRMQALEAQAAALGERLRTRRALLQRRLHARLRLDEAGHLRMLLEARDPTELVQRRHALQRVLRHDVGLLQGLSRDQASLEAMRADVQAAVDAIAADRAVLATRRAEMEGDRRVKAAVLAAVRRERDTLARLQAARAGAGESLDRTLQATLGAMSSASLESGSLARLSVGMAGQDFAAEKGRLPMPAPGRLAGRFGRREDPELGTFTVSKGVDLDAPLGAPVRSVHSGSVVYAGWYKGFGNLVIVAHGEDFHTLYAHLAAVGRERGEGVAAGDVLGEVGDTGSLRGPLLYFELRHQGRAVDPAEWLETTRRPR